MFAAIKSLIKKIPHFNKFYSRLRANKSINWSKLNKNYSHSISNKKNHVLMATSLGDYEMGVLLESCLSAALRLRDTNVDVLLCDSALNACQMSKIESISPNIMAKDGPISRCNSCIHYGRNIFKGAVDNELYFSDYILPEEKVLASKISKQTPYDQIKSYVYDGLSIGEHAYAGALRYYARGDLNNEFFGEQILRRYFKSALLTVFCMDRVLEQNNYDVVCFHHGIYVPQGLITQVCQKKNIRVVTWNPAYKSNTFIFSHYDSYHHTMISEDISRWQDIEMNETKENAIKKYLKSRRQGTNDWIWFHDTPEENADKIKDELGCSFDRPAIGLFTNVMWDAQLHYESNAFENMLDWVFASIDYFSKRKDLELFIRIHPAEIRGAIPSRQPLLKEIYDKYESMPDNVYVIPPESQISTYALMDKCNAVTIYNTKTGIEVASEGIPTIVAGEAWIRGKGFAIDVNSKDEYFKILEDLPFKSKMSNEHKLNALKYAYHFFMRRMIPIPFIEFDSKTGLYSSTLQSTSNLQPGNFQGLDLICNGILNGTPFEFDDEDYLEQINS